MRLQFFDPFTTEDGPIVEVPTDNAAEAFDMGCRFLGDGGRFWDFDILSSRDGKRTGELIGTPTDIVSRDCSLQPGTKVCDACWNGRPSNCTRRTQ